MATKYPNNIRAARLRASLTQQQVADHLHLTKASVCGWEVGQSRPDPANARRLMQLLPELTFDDIYPPVGKAA